MLFPFSFIILSILPKDSCLLNQDSCISFQVGPNTGCDWMCNYCANQLGTNNYYFTDNVCKYKLSGCEGSPQLGVEYTCCSSSLLEDKNITIFLNNINNNLLNNPPGFNLLISGEDINNIPSIIVNYNSTKLNYTIPRSTLFMLTWYYNDLFWHFNIGLQGPWEDGETIILPKVNI